MDTTCGATTRAGTPCRRRPVPGRERCRLHGGASTGPRTPEGHDRAREARTTHGIYADAMGAAEVEAVTGADADLSHELLVARVQVRRALLAWDEWAQGNPEALPAEEHTSSVDGKGSEAITIKRRRPDLWGIIDRCLGRVGRLTEQRARVEEVRELAEEMDVLRGQIEGSDR